MAESASQPNPLALARSMSRRERGLAAQPGQKAACCEELIGD
jgi:hypothetical protein